MADMMADAASWLAGEMQDHLAQEVTYRRGGKTISLAATKGGNVTEVDTQFGILKIVGTDWIIAASELVYQSTAWTPQKNDVIEEASGAQWQVLSLTGDSESRHSDPFGYSWRIHTKRIET